MEKYKVEIHDKLQYFRQNNVCEIQSWIGNKTERRRWVKIKTCDLTQKDHYDRSYC